MLKEENKSAIRFGFLVITKKPGPTEDNEINSTSGSSFKNLSLSAISFISG